MAKEQKHDGSDFHVSLLTSVENPEKIPAKLPQEIFPLESAD